MDTLPQDVVLSVQDISISYLAHRGRTQAVNRVSFDLRKGETLALIGKAAGANRPSAWETSACCPRPARSTGSNLVCGADRPAC